MGTDDTREPFLRMHAVAPPDGSTVLTLIQPPPNSPRAKLIGRATQTSNRLPTGVPLYRRFPAA